MSKVCFCISLGLCLLIPLTRCWAADPADQFLNAYFLIQEADAAEKADDKAKATEKYKDALEILVELQKSEPLNLSNT